MVEDMVMEVKENVELLTVVIIVVDVVVGDRPLHISIKFTTLNTSRKVLTCQEDLMGFNGCPNWNISTYSAESEKKNDTNHPNSVRTSGKARVLVRDCTALKRL